MVPTATIAQAVWIGAELSVGRLAKSLCKFVHTFANDSRARGSYILSATCATASGKSLANSNRVRGFDPGNPLAACLPNALRQFLFFIQALKLFTLKVGA